MIVSVTVHPHPETEDDLDLAQRVAAREALIEEARRRARRRRAVCAAAALALAVAGLAAFFGSGSGGGRASLGNEAAAGLPRSSAAPRAAVLAPPLCSSAGSASVLTTAPGHLLISVQTPANETDNAVYTRWCGPATIVAHLRGATYRIRGGRCDSTSGYLVRAGLVAQDAARGHWVGIFLHDARAQHPGTFTLSEDASGTRYASAELRGHNLQVIPHGTVTIGRSMRTGTFAIPLADGASLTGSWTCG